MLAEKPKQISWKTIKSILSEGDHICLIIICWPFSHWVRSVVTILILLDVHFIGDLYLCAELTPEHTPHSSKTCGFFFFSLTVERLSVYFTGLTLGIHDSLDVKTSKLAFRTRESDEEKALKCFLWVVNVRNVCRQRWGGKSFKRFLKERE